MHRVAESHPVRTSISLHYHIAGIATEMCRSTDLSLLYLTYLWQWEYAVDSSFGSTRPLGHHFAGKNGPVIPFHGLFGHGRKSMNRLIRQACCASRPGCSPVLRSPHISPQISPQPSPQLAFVPQLCLGCCPGSSAGVTIRTLSICLNRGCCSLQCVTYCSTGFRRVARNSSLMSTVCVVAFCPHPSTCICSSQAFVTTDHSQPVARC